MQFFCGTHHGSLRKQQLFMYLLTTFRHTRTLLIKKLGGGRRKENSCPSLGCDQEQELSTAPTLTASWKNTLEARENPQILHVPPTLQASSESVTPLHKCGRGEELRDEGSAESLLGEPGKKPSRSSAVARWLEKNQQHVGCET